MFTFVCSLMPILKAHLALETGHTSPHDLVNKQQVRGDHSATVDHLLLDPVIVINSFILRHNSLPRVTVHSNGRIQSSLLKQLDNNFLSIIPSILSQYFRNDEQSVSIGLDTKSSTTFY